MKMAATSFLTDLLENKLRIRDHLQDAAAEMEREEPSDRIQGLQAEIAAAKHALGKLQDGYLDGIFEREEASIRSLDAREQIEKAERKIHELETVSGAKDDLTGALRLLEVPLSEFLESMPTDHLARLCRAVFRRFTVKTSGYGWGRQGLVDTYELTPAIKQALLDSVHNDLLVIV